MRVSIEPAAMQHAARIQVLVSHPEILASTLLPAPYPEDGAVRWIRGLGKRAGGSTEHGFVVINDEGELVGMCGFIHSTREMDVAEVGFWIGRAYWNRGYATQALRLLLDGVFQDDRISRVRARTLRSNRTSCRVLEKLGFAVRGQAPNTHPKWGRQEAVRLYELMRQEWLACLRS